MPEPTYQNKSFNQKGLEKFFGAYFYADFLERQDSLEEALEDYLNSESYDPQGKQLLADIEKLQARNLSEDELVNLIEKEWGAQVNAQEDGISYRDVLTQLQVLLSKDKAG